MYKKQAFRLVVALLFMPLAASASHVESPGGPIRPVLAQLSQACGKAPPTLDSAALERLFVFYQSQDFEPVWRGREQLDNLRLQLQALADDGLEPADYQPAGLEQPVQPDDNRQQRACHDVFVSHGYLLALQHLTQGRLDQDRVEPIWRSEPAPIAIERQRLLAIAEAGLDDLPGAFDQARPSLAQYRNLRRAYARLRDMPQTQWRALASGPTLRPGQEDPRVPLLRQRLINEGYLPAENASDTDPDRYQGPLIDALKAFQMRHALQDDGLVGAATLAALNASPQTRLEQLRINLERWRWLARNLEPNSLLVDIAAGRLIFYRDSQPVWQTRTQVGTAGRPTPALKSTLNRLSLNPTWTIPPTILRKDKLPRIRQDINYLAQHDLSVLDLQGNPLDPHSIDWNQPRGILLRQSAGPSNPLGQVAFRFANPFSVYLHDTPSQPLFARAPRAFSSGCVRVEAARQLIDLLLTEDERERVADLLEQKRSYEYRLEQPMPILMAYWTAEADEAGRPLYRPDVYGQDPALSKALAAALRR